MSFAKQVNFNALKREANIRFQANLYNIFNTTNLQPFTFGSNETTVENPDFGLAPGSDQGRAEAQILIRHPNYSGMQMDQVTRLYVPAHFVKSVRIRQGDDLLLSIDSGISISENPAFRFDYRPNGAASFSAEVEDSDGRSFRQEWPATPT